MLTWSWKQLHTVPKLKICMEELNRLDWEFEITVTNKQFRSWKDSTCLRQGVGKTQTTTGCKDCA